MYGIRSSGSPHRDIQGSSPFLVLHNHVGSLIDKKLNDGRRASHRSAVQRRVPILVHRVHVLFKFDEQFDRLNCVGIASPADEVLSTPTPAAAIRGVVFP